ncbi:hypothetical protein [Actinoallomurus iriomotensis]|uniref:DUF4352 domain-containing protein n=1 Tax=Actinoallomurus iriomotensis TaxID=478107 RepID=A0A9W6S1V4_9ACTN|nr:hypothetical protein [Actinoallomurus iriomotensis]GLY85698.1 hypothetical protein Airi02_036270 [Actinoallomurus iriomotensis]
MPGLASVAAGVIAGRFIGRLGSRTVLAAGLAVVALSTLPLVFLGPGRGALVILVPGLFAGFFGHVSACVAFTVTATSPTTAAIGTAQRRTSDGITVAVTVYNVRSVKSHADVGEPSRHFVGIDARVCVTAASGGAVPLSQQPWTVDYADDTQAEPITEWWDGEFSVPLYPAERKVAAGHCVRGWIVFKPLKGRATTVSYAPGSGEPAFWRIP